MSIKLEWYMFLFIENTDEWEELISFQFSQLNYLNRLLCFHLISHVNLYNQWPFNQTFAHILIFSEYYTLRF